MQGWFNPGQVFVLDEYCARYGVRGCKRHLFYLHELLNNAERGVAVDPSLMHYSFAFCASHVHGHRFAATVCHAKAALIALIAAWDSCDHGYVGSVSPQ